MNKEQLMKEIFLACLSGVAGNSAVSTTTAISRSVTLAKEGAKAYENIINEMKEYEGSTYE